MGMTQPIATTRSVTGMSTGKLATYWLIASEIIIFGGLLGSYILLRVFHTSWADEAAHTSVLAGGVNTFILLTSSLFAVLAHYHAEHKDGQKAAKYLWLAFLAGACFLGVKSFEWYHEIQAGYVITKSLFWGFYYTAAGIHALHIIAGMIIMALVARQAKKGINLQRVEYIGLYWHFVDIVWIFLFPLLYIAK